MADWQQLPADAGQIVDVKYDVDWETRTLYKRVEDRNDGSVQLWMGRIADGEDRYEPWNGILPKVTKWVAEGGA
jgi:hypothetical protein